MSVATFILTLGSIISSLFYFFLFSPKRERKCGKKDRKQEKSESARRSNGLRGQSEKAKWRRESVIYSFFQVVQPFLG